MSDKRDIDAREEMVFDGILFSGLENRANGSKSGTGTPFPCPHRSRLHNVSDENVVILLSVCNKCCQSLRNHKDPSLKYTVLRG